MNSNWENGVKFKDIEVNSLEITVTIHIPLKSFNVDYLDIPSPKFCNYIINQLRNNNYKFGKITNGSQPYPVLSLFGEVTDVVKINFLNEDNLNRFLIENS